MIWPQAFPQPDPPSLFSNQWEDFVILVYVRVFCAVLSAVFNLKMTFQLKWNVTNVTE